MADARALRQVDQGDDDQVGRISGKDMAVPVAGREAMYATWYTFHHVREPAVVLAECRLARELGCMAVIVDDGWQMLDSSRGYHRAGEWHPERRGDMRD